jgi:hypothetical protein
MRKHKLLLLSTVLLLLSSCSFLEKVQIGKRLVIKELDVTVNEYDFIPTIDMTKKVDEPPVNMVMPSPELLASSAMPHTQPSFFPIVQPIQKMRNDTRGDGYFGASRGRRMHNGLDIITVPHSAVYCPIEGIMKRVAYPYGTGGSNERWTGCVIDGIGPYRGYEVKIFYMEPFLMGEFVYPNDIIGKAQAISDKYSPDMIDHLHVEVRYHNQLIDPASLFDLVR